MEKSKWTFGPTQSFWQLKPQWARNITTDVQILALPHALRCLKLVSSTFWTFISPAVKLALLNISVVVVCGLNEIDWRESLSNLVTVLTVLEFSLYVSSLLSVTSLGLDFQFPLYFSILPSPNTAGGGVLAATCRSSSVASAGSPPWDKTDNGKAIQFSHSSFTLWIIFLYLFSVSLRGYWFLRNFYIIRLSKFYLSYALLFLSPRFSHLPYDLEFLPGLPWWLRW